VVGVVDVHVVGEVGAELVVVALVRLVVVLVSIVVHIVVLRAPLGPIGVGIAVIAVDGEQPRRRGVGGCLHLAVHNIV